MTNLTFSEKNDIILEINDTESGENMVLALDVGNSEISIGVFRNGSLSFVSHISTDTNRTADEYAIKILSILNLYTIDRKTVKGVVISSVVPQLNFTLRKSIQFVFDTEPLFVGPGVKTGLGIQCDMPSSVGADLICACVAVRKICNGAALIIDIGTATKMMVVNKKGAFIGASIIPGVMMGLNALAKETAQLPGIDLDIPSAIIAKNTVDCMKSGIIFGHASMLDGMIERFFEAFGEELPVYVTGGLASLIVPHCKHPMILREHLVLDGLHTIYQKNC